ncbi:hypothetical protein [Lysinibacillus sp. Bpr_S20]|uniref:hypothetical protein n=1 Tax=Lysinibacillus sp. Bpr_S20 TaxID=2933964 RepID=UPI002012ACB0|nr:hypothetical protein [Lysinibacillus sp. Bpr_S20]MCL1701185.1 hypothetical protein [Lysinibacillus sp. Bpr_S20]
MKKRIVYPLMMASIIGSGALLVSSNNSEKYSGSITAEAATYDSADVIKNIDSEKINVQNLMLNSIDNFKTAKGSFTYYSNSGKYNLNVEYNVNLTENPKSYEKVQSLEFNSKDNSFKKASFEPGYEESLYDGNSFTKSRSADNQINGLARSADAQTSTVEARPATKEEREFKKGTTMEERIEKMPGGEKAYIKRVDPSLMGIAKTSLFPEDIAMGLLENTDSWNITGEGNISGIKTFVIQGKLNNDYATRYNAQDFELEVDQKTGILLVFKAIDSNGNVKESIITNEIELNSVLDSSSFKLSNN